MTGDPECQDVIARELRLHDPAVRRAPDVAGELLDPMFHEFGASGRMWDRTSILDEMAGHDEPPPATDDMVATRLAADVILLTYRTHRPGRTALRSSIWRRREGRAWRIYFHQGTVVPPRPDEISSDRALTGTWPVPPPASSPAGAGPAPSPPAP